MKPFKLVKTMLMNAPVSLTMAVVAQVMSLILGHISALNIGEMALSFVVSYLFACVIGYFIPTDRWGMAFAQKSGARPGSRKFDILVNLVVNTFFCIVMTVFMTWFSLCVRGHAPHPGRARRIYGDDPSCVDLLFLCQSLHPAARDPHDEKTLRRGIRPEPREKSPCRFSVQ